MIDERPKPHFRSSARPSRTTTLGRSSPLSIARASCLGAVAILFACTAHSTADGPPLDPLSSPSSDVPTIRGDVTAHIGGDTGIGGNGRDSAFYGGSPRTLWSRVFMTDVTGDRVADLVVIADDGAVNVSTSESHWTGHVRWASTDLTRSSSVFDAQNHAPRLWLADMTNDGRADLVTVDDDGSVRVFVSTGHSFRSAISSDCGFSLRDGWFLASDNPRVWLTDWNHDGWLDVVGVSRAGVDDGAVFVCFNHTSRKAMEGQLAATSLRVGQTDLKSSAGWFDASSRPSVFVADVDGDGCPDLIGLDRDGVPHVARNACRSSDVPFSIAGSRREAVSAPLAGLFGTRWRLTSEHPRIFVGDFDGDGRADLLGVAPATSSPSTEAVDGDLWVMKQASDGTSGWNAQLWTPASFLKSGDGWFELSHAPRVFVGDVTRDGRSDVIGIAADGRILTARSRADGRSPDGIFLPPLQIGASDLSNAHHYFEPDEQPRVWLTSQTPTEHVDLLAVSPGDAHSSSVVLASTYWIRNTHRHFEGYAKSVSIAAGSPIDIALHVPGKKPVKVDVIRHSDGHVVPGSAHSVAPIPQDFPADAASVGAQWSTSEVVRTSATADWRSGLYSLRYQENGVDRDVPFVVKAPDGAPPKVLVVVSTNTWAAYNGWPRDVDDYDPARDYPGSIYPGVSDGRTCSANDAYEEAGCLGLHAPFISMLRPNSRMRMQHDTAVSRAGGEHYGPGHALLEQDSWLFRWLDASPFASIYGATTDWDIDRDGALPSPATTPVLIFGPHHEFWTKRMYDAVVAYLHAGGTVLNLGGNVAYKFGAFCHESSCPREFRDHVMEYRNGRFTDGAQPYAMSDLDCLDRDRSSAKYGQYLPITTDPALVNECNIKSHFPGHGEELGHSATIGVAGPPCVLGGRPRTPAAELFGTASDAPSLRTRWQVRVDMRTCDGFHTVAPPAPSDPRAAWYAEAMAGVAATRFGDVGELSPGTGGSGVPAHLYCTCNDPAAPCFKGRWPLDAPPGPFASVPAVSGEWDRWFVPNAGCTTGTDGPIEIATSSNRDFDVATGVFAAAGAHMTYWKHPDGGTTFSGGAIGFTQALHADLGVSGRPLSTIIGNVIRAALAR